MATPIRIAFTSDTAEALSGFRSMLDTMDRDLSAFSNKWAQRLGQLFATGSGPGVAAAASSSAVSAAMTARLNAMELQVQVLQSRFAAGGPHYVSPATGAAGAIGASPTGLAQQAAAAVQNVAARAQQAGTAINNAMTRAFAPLASAWRGFNRIESGILRLAGTVYVLERIGRAVESSVLGPIRKTLEAAEEARRFEMAIASSVGGMGNARGVNAGVEQGLSGSSLTLDETRQAIMAMTKVSVLQPSLAFGGPEAAGRLTNLVSGLATLNPGESVDRITTALTQSLEGTLRGLRFSLHIDPDDLARLVGASKASDLQGNPQLVLTALERYVQRNVSPDAQSERANLLSVQMQKLRDDFTIVGERIAETGGLFDKVVSRIRAGAESLLAYVNSPQFEGRARQIGENLGQVFDHLTDGLLRLLSSLSGEKSIQRTPDSIAQGMESLTARLAEWSKAIPDIARETGMALHDLAGYLIEFVGFLRGLKESPLSSSERVDLIRARVNEQGLGYAGVTLGQTPLEKGKWPGLRDVLNNIFMIGGEDAQEERADRMNTPSLVFSGIANPADRMRAKLLAGAAKDLPDAALRDPSLFRLMTMFGFNGVSGSAAATSGSTTIFDALRAEMGGGHEIDPVAGFYRRFSGLDSTIARVGGGYDEFADPIAKLLLTARANYAAVSPYLSSPGALAASYGTDILGAMPDALMQDALQGGNRFGDLSRYYQMLNEAAQRKSADLAKQLDGAVSNLGEALAKAIRGESASYRADLMGRIIRGEQGGLIGIPGADALTRGIASRPLNEQPGILDEYLQARLEKIALTPGLYPVGTLSGPGRSDLEMQAMQEAMREQLNVMGRANGILAQGGTPEQMQRAQQAFDHAADSVDKLIQKMDDLQQKSNEALQGFIKFGDQTQQTLGNSLGQVFTSLETHANNLREIVKQMASSILNDFNQMAGHLFVNTLFNQIGGAVPNSGEFGGGLGGIFGALISGAAFRGAGAAASASAGEALFAASGAASGGIFGGFDVHGFSGGGIASRPMIGIVGERADRAPEAVVPMSGGRIPLGRDGYGFYAALPGGRKIRASAFASGGIAEFGGDYSGGVAGSSVGGAGMIGGDGPAVTHVTIYNVANHEQAMQAGYSKLKGHILNDVLAEAQPGRTMRRVLARPN